MKKHLLIALAVAISAFFGQSVAINQNRYLENISPELQALLLSVNSNTDFQDVDIAFWIRGTAMANIINSANTIPPDRRQISVQLISENKKLDDNGNYYLELEDLPNNRANANLKNIQAAWTNAGGLQFSSGLDASGSVKLHGHYKPLNVGGHVGFDLHSDAIINGKTTLLKDPAALFSVQFDVLPSDINYGVHTSIKDQKELCWRIEYPCLGTIQDPFRKCEGKDCKTLWAYEIPINLSNKITISGAASRMPVKANIPQEIIIEKEVEGVKFKKSLSVDVTPADIVSNAQGVLIKTNVKIK